METDNTLTYTYVYIYDTCLDKYAGLGSNAGAWANGPLGGHSRNRRSWYHSGTVPRGGAAICVYIFMCEIYIRTCMYMCVIFEYIFLRVKQIPFQCCVEVWLYFNLFLCVWNLYTYLFIFEFDTGVLIHECEVDLIPRHYRVEVRLYLCTYIWVWHKYTHIHTHTRTHVCMSV